MSIKGGHRGAQRLIWLIAGGAAVLAGAVAWQADQGGWAAVLVAVGVLLPVAALLADKAAARAGDLDIEKIADRLAGAVRKQWADEATRREIASPPLAVSWRPADQSLVQKWTYLQQLAGDGAGRPTPTATAAGPQDLAGSGSQILATYDRSPCGRLVVLGEPGAGKTVLLIRLVLDLIARRQPGEPVPVLVPLASWNPDGQKLNDWLESQILRTYPDLTATISVEGKSRARALVDNGLILPVLDGLDEIRGGSRTRALAKINATLGNHTGIVLSSRRKEFRLAVRPRPSVKSVLLEGAAGVQLEPIPPLVVADYLIATAGEGRQAWWAPVQARLTSSGTPLARTLVTPLMATLARTVYNPRDGESTLDLPDPANLVALPSVDAIEQHLLAGFVPAAYRSHDDQSSRWSADQASRYLTFLAHHLEHRLRTTNLAWWELPRVTSRRLPLCTAWLASGLIIWYAPGLIPGIVLGLVIGLALRLAVGLDRSTPRQVTLRRPRPIDLAFGVAFGTGVGLVTEVAGGLVFGLVFGLAHWLGIGRAADTRLAASPITVLTQDRIHTLAAGFGATLVAGLGAALAAQSAANLWVKLAISLTAGLAAGLAFGLSSAWGALGSARFWLAASRKQPPQLIAFLQDAHDRGVLRQAGAVWEFRHAELQRYLAGPP